MAGGLVRLGFDGGGMMPASGAGSTNLVSQPGSMEACSEAGEGRGGGW